MSVISNMIGEWAKKHEITNAEALGELINLVSSSTNKAYSDGYEDGQSDCDED